MKGILGRKVGMTQVFTKEGKLIPVTVIEVEPNVITQIKTVEKDGYDAIQLGCETVRAKVSNKAKIGHTNKANTEPKRFLREIRGVNVNDYTLGQVIDASLFTKGEIVDVSGVSEGKGFQGVIKRYNQSRGPMGHGSQYHRGVGSLGTMLPMHVLKGKKLPGHMGNVACTIQNLEVVDVDLENNVILVKGNVPGPKKSLVMIRTSVKKGEKVNVLVAVPKDDESETLLFVTKNGIVKRTSVSEFENINRNGKIAISLKPDDELRFVKLTTGQDEVIISGSNGKAVRFNEDQVRIMGRSASGVLGFNCDGSEVVGAALSSEGDTVLVVSENGYGKRSKFEDYRLTSRGKKGVSTINITEKTGKLMCMRAVTGKEDAMIVASDGIMIRVALENVGIYGRNTQGVRLINLNGDAKVTRMTLVDHEEPEVESEENTEE